MNPEKPDMRSSAAIARVFGLTSKRVQQLTADGVLETTETPKGRRYDFLPTIQRYVKYLSDKASGREKDRTTASLEEQKLEAEVRLKEAKAESAELELAELRGEMHRAEDVEAVTTDHVLLLRSMLMSLPGRLAVDCAQAQTPAEASEQVRREVYGILNSLTQYRYDPEEYRKRVRDRNGWGEAQDDDDESN